LTKLNSLNTECLIFAQHFSASALNPISASFFDISKFGEATFTINKVEYINADRATIKGDLNLKGIKAPVTFTAIIRNADDKGFFAEAFFPFDRTVFGINYGAGMVDKDVQLAIHIYGTK
jgi:polyisoprenoid-binding protein YceI